MAICWPDCLCTILSCWLWSFLQVISLSCHGILSVDKDNTALVFSRIWRDFETDFNEMVCTQRGKFCFFVVSRQRICFWKLLLGRCIVLMRFTAFLEKKSMRRLFEDVLVKVAFFQKVPFVFQISRSLKKKYSKNYPELEI